MKTTVKTYDGKEISIRAFQESLRMWPMNIQAKLSDDGHPFLQGATYRPSGCGCTIEGNGTLQFPLRIKPCDKHCDKPHVVVFYIKNRPGQQTERFDSYNEAKAVVLALNYFDDLDSYSIKPIR